MEQRLTTKIEERDKQNADLITKITAMEQTFNQKAHSIEMLERTSTHLQYKERELTSQLDEKDREMTIYKQSVESEFYIKEQDLLEQLQLKAANEIHLTQQMHQLERELNETKVSKDIVERLLEERGNLLRNLEDDLDKKKGNL